MASDAPPICCLHSAECRYARDPYFTLCAQCKKAFCVAHAHHLVKEPPSVSARCRSSRWFCETCREICPAGCLYAGTKREINAELALPRCRTCDAARCGSWLCSITCTSCKSLFCTPCASQAVVECGGELEEAGRTFHCSMPVCKTCADTGMSTHGAHACKRVQTRCCL